MVGREENAVVKQSFVSFLIVLSKWKQQMDVHAYSKGKYGTCKWKTFLLRLKQDTALREED